MLWYTQREYAFNIHHISLSNIWVVTDRCIWKEIKTFHKSTVIHLKNNRGTIYNFSVRISHSPFSLQQSMFWLEWAQYISILAPWSCSRMMIEGLVWQSELFEFKKAALVNIDLPFYHPMVTNNLGLRQYVNYIYWNSENQF